MIFIFDEENENFHIFLVKAEKNFTSGGCLHSKIIKSFGDENNNGNFYASFVFKSGKSTKNLYS